MSVVLHGHPRSSATARVRIALELKQVSYTERTVDLFELENLGEPYKAVNPMGQVPTLDIDGLRLTQSVPICEYLDETRPTPPFFPEGAAARVRCRELVELVNAGIQPLQNKGVLDKIIADYGDPRLERMFAGAPSDATDAGDTWPQHWIRKGFGAFESKLAESAGRYCIGDSASLADIVLAPQVRGTVAMYDMDLDPFPTIGRVYAALVELPAFRSVAL